MLVYLGLFGLVASFPPASFLGYSRQIFALARAAYLPRYFAFSFIRAFKDSAPRHHRRRRDRSYCRHL